jgi:hypothetical protein
MANILGGSEWMLGSSKQHILGVNLRATFAGGLWMCPIDEAASLEAKREILDESRVWEERNPFTVYVSATLNWKINKAGLTHEIGLQMMNLTFEAEYFAYYYNYREQKMTNRSTAVAIPNIYYKIHF